MAGLTHNQLIFRDRLADRLGLSKEVVGAWIYHEQNGSAAQSYEKRHYYNWLNIGRTDSGDTGDAAHSIWSDPTRAADATVSWIQHKSAPAIRNALKGARGKSPEAQAAAIANSPWASSHYGGPQGLISLFKIGGAGSGGGGGASAPSTAGEGPIKHKAVPGFSVNLPTSTDSTSFDQAGFDQAQKRSVLANYLSKRNPHSLLLRSGALSTQTPNPADFTTTSTQVGTEKFTVPGTEASGGSSSAPAGGLAATAKQRADAINAKHMPYLWGGGHGAIIKDASKATPLDCSGAVSAVLGIDPRVSGGFTKWGRPGDGGNQGVTVYANDHHVLMKINGHFFGTSGSNPGGGAGWIPAGALSKDYLAGFTVRHSNR